LHAAVWFWRHQKHPEDWSYWTVRWTPPGGTSGERQLPGLAGMRCGALRPAVHGDVIYFDAWLGEQFLDITVAPE
jgi:hypothetical protein